MVHYQIVHMTIMEKIKTETESTEKEDDQVITDSTGAPSDPSIANLPKDRESKAHQIHLTKNEEIKK